MIYESKMYHSGVLGQKWGKRNGPPYPLSPGDHSASEKKAGWRQSLSDSGGKTKEELHKEAYEKMSKIKTKNPKKRMYKEANIVKKMANRELEEIADREAPLKQKMTKAENKRYFEVRKAARQEAENCTKKYIEGVYGEQAYKDYVKHEQTKKMIQRGAGVATMLVPVIAITAYTAMG